MLQRHPQSMLIMALFTIAKVPNHPRFLSTDEWIRKYGINAHWDINKPQIKQNQVVYRKMNGIRSYHASEISQTQISKYGMFSPRCRNWNLKK